MNRLPLVLMALCIFFSAELNGDETKVIRGTAMLTSAFTKELKVRLKKYPSLGKKLTLFIVATHPDRPKPPVAVLRIDQPKFPQSFELTQEHSIFGEELKGAYALKAKLSFTGYADTQPGDFFGASRKPVAIGSTGITLLLDREEK